MQMLPSWYQPDLSGLTKEQWAYVKLITEIFNMKTETGKVIPYIPTPYQVEFHAASLNVLKESAQDILFEKARGVSFTMTSAIELIMSANYFKDLEFPVIAQRYGSAKGIVNNAKWLIRHANVNLEDSVEMLETEIRFLETGSVIKPYPSASASDAVRSLRLIRAMLDEYAFQQRDTELLAACQDTMIGKYSQLIIGSTPCGINNSFYELVQNPVGFKTFRLPAFEENKFDYERNILDQKLTPIAPWLDLDNLEKRRSRDIEIFKQENMCSFMDDSISYLPFALIKKCENPGLVNYLHVLDKNPDFVYESQNPMYMGFDFATVKDLTAVTIFEKVPLEDRYALVQRYIVFFKNKTTPEQEKATERLLRAFPQVVKIRIDATGPGTGLYQYLYRTYGARVDGVHFASRVRAGGKVKIPIKERMAVNLKNLMQEEPAPAINLIVDDLQEKHLNDVDYNFNAIRRVGEGHGDMFWAVALAVLPENYRAPPSGKLETYSRPYSQGLPVIESDKHFEVVKKANEMTWDEKLKFLQQQQGKGRRTMR